MWIMFIYVSLDYYLLHWIRVPTNVCSDDIDKTLTKIVTSRRQT